MSRKPKNLFFALLFFSLFAHNTTFCMIDKIMQCLLGFDNKTCGEESIAREGARETLKAVNEMERLEKEKNTPTVNATMNAFCEHTQKKPKKKKKK